MAESGLERHMAVIIRSLELPEPERELRFAPPRRWRFDFAWGERDIAVEVEGGTWTGGRHVTGRGFENDCIKYNQAALMGWMVLRFTEGMLDDGTARETLAQAFTLNG